MWFKGGHQKEEEALQKHLGHAHSSPPLHPGRRRRRLFIVASSRSLARSGPAAQRETRTTSSFFSPFLFAWLLLVSSGMKRGVVLLAKFYTSTLLLSLLYSYTTALLAYTLGHQCQAPPSTLGSVDSPHPHTPTQPRSHWSLVS
jgi:hypothetical protein